jgi:CRISPR-associated protein Cmr6
MSVPLYRADGGQDADSSARTWEERSRQREANLGLVFDKFFANWSDDFAGYAKDGKKEKAKPGWVEHIANASKAASPEALRLAIARQNALVAALGGKSWTVTAASRFVTGTGIANPLENGFAFHHTLGVPYLAATGLKGALLAYWEQWHVAGDEQQHRLLTARLFGEKGVGSVVFLDMLPTKPPTLVSEVMTPHYREWYAASRAADIAANAPGDWMSPTPIPFLAVEAGATFQLAIAPRTAGDPEWPGHRQCIANILADALGGVGLGAKTAVGYGRFELSDGKSEAQAVSAPRPVQNRPRGSRAGGAAAYQAGQTLRAGTRLSWLDEGDVVLVGEATLRPGMTLRVRFVDNGEDDNVPVGEIPALRHIR